MESVDLAIKNTQLPESLTKDDFTRAVAVATVSALRHQQGQSISPARLRTSVAGDLDTGAGGHAGHEAPEWSRTTSAAVLLACTALYAIIAGMSYINGGWFLQLIKISELLIDVVDFVLKGSGIDEKFLGITLFALVPNTTEFMNAISFALNENIALRCVLISATPLFADDPPTIAWKSALRMRFKCVFSKFLPWWPFLRGMLPRRWGKLHSRSREFLLAVSRYRSLRLPC